MAEAKDKPDFEHQRHQAPTPLKQARKRIGHMTLAAEEFIRRFLLHVLPNGFVKIRHYGISSNRNRRTKLARCKEFLGRTPTPPSPPAKIDWQERLVQLTGWDPSACTSCGQGRMRTVQVLSPASQRAPPGRVRLVS